MSGAWGCCLGISGLAQAVFESKLSEHHRSTLFGVFEFCDFGLRSSSAFPGLGCRLGGFLSGSN